MNKVQFMTGLSESLHRYRLSDEERKDILSDYEEYFTVGLEEGKTEEEIAAGLGAPAQIAREIMADYHLERVTVTSSSNDFFRAILAVAGLGFFNLVFVLGPLMAIVGILIAGWTVGGAFVLSPLLAIISNAINADFFEAFTFFVSIALSGIGLFILIGMYYATKGLGWLFIRYLKFNVSVVKGGDKS